MPKQKIVERPEVVHQTKEMKGAEITTKCGLVGKTDAIRHSSWHSEITCDECSP